MLLRGQNLLAQHYGMTVDLFDEKVHQNAIKRIRIFDAINGMAYEGRVDPQENGASVKRRCDRQYTRALILWIWPKAGAMGADTICIKDMGLMLPYERTSLSRSSRPLSKCPSTCKYANRRALAT